MAPPSTMLLWPLSTMLVQSPPCTMAIPSYYTIVQQPHAAATALNLYHFQGTAVAPPIYCCLMYCCCCSLHPRWWWDPINWTLLCTASAPLVIAGHHPQPPLPAVQLVQCAIVQEKFTPGVQSVAEIMPMRAGRSLIMHLICIPT